MPVLERQELQESPLADLHAIANQVGLDGFRRLRKAELIDAILGEESPPASAADGDSDGETETKRPRRRRASRSRQSAASAEESKDDDTAADAEEPAPSRRGRGRGSRSSAGSSTRGEDSARKSERSEPADADGDSGRIAEGVVEVLGNGSAFLRVSPPEPSDDDIYISAAQVRRCELVSGDRVTGPVRTPRRSERYPSLVRVDTINGAPADTVSEGVRYDELPVAWPSERIALGTKDPLIEAIEWITPIGRGSRAVIVGGRHAGKTETLRRLAGALADVDGLELSVVLAGVRPEEIAEWQEGKPEPLAALSFAASPDSQAQAIERALDGAKRVAARGGHALVLIDTLDGLPPHAARKAIAAARNLRESGSLTVIATASAPVGGETTVIALDGALASTEREPILDLLASSTLKPELLVGDDGAAAIAKARADAIEAAS